MSYASESLLHFRTVFVQAAAVLLLAACGLLVAEAERVAHRKLFAPFREMGHVVRSLADVQPVALNCSHKLFSSVLEKDLQKKGISSGLIPGDAVYPFPLDDRPVGLAEIVPTRLPSWRGLVAFPLPPPASV